MLLLLQRCTLPFLEKVHYIPVFLTAEYYYCLILVRNFIFPLAASNLIDEFNIQDSYIIRYSRARIDLVLHINFGRLRLG
jgi:hypothetical protein